MVEQVCQTAGRAEAEFGVGESELGRATGKSHGRHQGDLEAAAKRVTIDGGDYRFVEQARLAAKRLVEFGGLHEFFVAHGVHRLDVGTHAKRPTFARDYDRANVGVTGRRTNRSD